MLSLRNNLFHKLVRTRAALTTPVRQIRFDSTREGERNKYPAEIPRGGIDFSAIGDLVDFQTLFMDAAATQRQVEKLFREIFGEHDFFHVGSADNKVVCILKFNHTKPTQELLQCGWLLNSAEITGTVYPNYEIAISNTNYKKLSEQLTRLSKSVWVKENSLPRPR